MKSSTKHTKQHAFSSDAERSTFRLPANARIMGVVSGGGSVCLVTFETTNPAELVERTFDRDGLEYVNGEPETDLPEFEKDRDGCTERLFDLKRGLNRLTVLEGGWVTGVEQTRGIYFAEPSGHAPEYERTFWLLKSWETVSDELAARLVPIGAFCNGNNLLKSTMEVFEELQD